MKLIRAKATGALIGLCGVALIGVGAADGKSTLAPKAEHAGGPCQIVNNPEPDHVTANHTVRSYLDDLAVPDGGCLFNTFTVKGAWDTLEPGAGNTVELVFHGDAGGQPVSIPFAAATITSYSEVATGVDYFGRPESEVTVTFDDLFLEGTVWVNVKVVGPEIFHPSLGCGPGQTGSIAWAFTDFFLLPAPIQFFAVDFCDSLSDLSWSIGFTP